MDPEVERKVAGILLDLEDTARRTRNFNNNAQQVMDQPDVSRWLTECRAKGWGDANLFSLGKR